ncbi:MAG: hypothetical protein LQ349_006525 [Xanthoria aureola]|nr:MAG: hypothetical protein LQ349_006525 [Xanthoria aureola]
MAIRQVHLQTYMVTPKEVSDALKKNVPTKISTAPRVIPLCAAWFLPNDPKGRTGQQVFKQKRIPSARFFDLDAVKDHESPYPHMLPTAPIFAKAMQDLGIRKDDEIVVYDTHELGIFSAPRVAWTLKLFGHPGVHILNNFRLWVEQGFPTESGEVEAVEGAQNQYPTPTLETSRVVDFDEMKGIAKDYLKEGAEGVQVLDARSQGRWAGSDPEPRPGLSSGHIPGSINVPVPELLNPETGALLPGDELRKLFILKGVDPEKPIISSCGTGVSAAVIEVALEEADFGQPEARRLYDGSWTEWAQRTSEADGLIPMTSKHLIALARPFTSLPRCLNARHSYSVPPLSRPVRPPVPGIIIGGPHRQYATRSTADETVDELTEKYATAKDEFEIASEETDKKSVYAADDRQAAREELDSLKQAFEDAAQGENGEEVRRRVGNRIRELEQGVVAMEERAMED